MTTRKTIGDTLSVCCQLLLFVAFFLSSNYLQADSSVGIPVVTPPGDESVYKSIKLENDLRLYLVSNSRLSSSAAVLKVNVGQYQDPALQPGLAHFVEHMIFQSSQKYPEPNAFQEYIAQNAGFSNAITFAQHTNYFFSIVPDKFKGALDRLGAAITNPLFDPVYVDKERNAVDQEWQRLRENDGFATQRINGLLGSKHHPLQRFGIGNLETLRDKGSSKLLAETRNFHKRFYSANLMTLVLVGPQSIPELRNLADKYFSSVPNREVDSPEVNIPYWSAEDTHREIVYYRSKSDVEELMLQFPLKDNSKYWRSNPNAYIYHLMSSEEKGSLIPTLREAGLIESASTMIAPRAYGKDGVFTVNFQLQEKGSENRTKILSAFFSYIEQLKENAVASEYANIFQGYLYEKFKRLQPKDPLTKALNIANNVSWIPFENILNFQFIYEEFNSEPILEALSQVNPESMRLWHISNDQKVDKALVYADGKYRTEPVTEDHLKKWSPNSDFAFSFPKTVQASSIVAKPPSKSEVKVSEVAKPKVVFKSDSSVVRNMPSQYFPESDEGILKIVIENPYSFTSAKGFMMSNLIWQRLTQNQSALFQKAERKYQNRLNINHDWFGNLELSLEGSVKHQPQLVERVVSELAELKFTTKNLEKDKLILAKDVEGFETIPVTRQLLHQSELAYKVPPFVWADEKRLQSVKGVSLAELKKHHARYLSQNYIDVFSFGPYSESALAEIVKSIRKKLPDSTTGVEKRRYKTAYQPTSGGFNNIMKSVSQKGAAVASVYVYPESSNEKQIQLAMLNMLIQNAFFRELRTEKQMAYELGTIVNDIHGYPAFSLFLQTTNTPLVEIKPAFDEFLVAFGARLRRMTPDVFEQLRSAAGQSLAGHPNNIYEEASPFLGDWKVGNFDFDMRITAIETVKKTTLDDLVTLYDSFLLGDVGEQTLIQIKGEDFNTADFYRKNTEKLR